MNGLIWGLIIALIALGLSIIFGLLDIINMAHGDFFMVGTVLAWATLQATGNFWLGFIVAPLIGFILGALIQRIVIQPIHNVAALSIVATFGLSLILQEGVRITFGPTPRRILPPIQGTVPMFGDRVRDLPAVCGGGCDRSRSAASSCSCNHTKLGTWMRAVRHDRDTAIAMGIPAQRVYILTFGIGFALAALRRRGRGADHDGRFPRRRRSPAVLLHGGHHRRPRQPAGHGGGGRAARASSKASSRASPIRPSRAFPRWC